MLSLNIDDIKNVQDAQLLPDGEYQVEIMKAEVKESKNTPGNFYVNLRLSVPSEPAAEDFYHMVHLVGSNDTEDQKRIRKMRAIKEFLNAFKVNLSGNPSEEELCNALEGKTGWAIVKTDSSDEFGDRNGVKRFVQSR